MITIYKQKKVETINIDTPNLINPPMRWNLSSPIAKKKIRQFIGFFVRKELVVCSVDLEAEHSIHESNTVWSPTL